MLFLILSILCSVTVGAIFKISRNYTVNIPQIVAWNYCFALLLCYGTFKPNLKAIDATSPWTIYLLLGLLLPSIFLLLAASIKHTGIVKTDAAQRLSLFIPLLAAWFIFREEFNMLKVIALVIAFPALLLILSKPNNNPHNKWIYPTFVFFGFGIIDILFKQIASYTNLPYTSSLFVIFCIAMLLIMIISMYQILIQKVKFTSINIIFGCLIGIFNFGNILFYLKAHKAFAENPSTVFAGMNLGVIIIGSLAGIFLFKEKISSRNYVGILLALVAIVLITFSQLYNK